jgi:muramidase (phage lysozyme)
MMPWTRIEEIRERATSEPGTYSLLLGGGLTASLSQEPGDQSGFLLSRIL